MPTRTESNTTTNSDALSSETTTAESSRRPYTTPRVISAERLEAAAATCDPPAGGFGKTIPLPCGVLGS
ncbi:MAG: hypothetical protein ACI9HY_000398 [Planctomycetaceae bacterium]|jgi:hypothetical protein